ncbi:MAG: hypothetical protein WCW14_05100 [Candidatus Paceibacterota bacterium]
MSWIGDAKKNAQAELQKEKNDRECKEAADKLAADLERARKMEIFHRYTDQSRREIEAVLTEARKQGLRIEGPREEYVITTDGGHNADLLYTYETIYYGSEGWGDTHRVYTRGYVWVVTEPNTLETFRITLYLISGKSGLELSVKDVETDIKDWLKEIYKNQ